MVLCGPYTIIGGGPQLCAKSTLARAPCRLGGRQAERSPVVKREKVELVLREPHVQLLFRLGVKFGPGARLQQSLTYV